MMDPRFRGNDGILQHGRSFCRILLITKYHYWTVSKTTRSIFRTLSRDTPKCLAAARSLIPSRHAKRTLRYSSTV